MINLSKTSSSTSKWGFSADEAMKHVKELTQLAPHPVDSDSLKPGLQYVLKEAENIKKTAHEDADVEVELFHASSDDHDANSSDIKHVVLKLSPKSGSDTSILVSSNIDTILPAEEGDGEPGSSVAVMLEVARGISQSAEGFKNTVIFAFNAGEDDGFNGAHSFITHHPLSNTVGVVVDLEAMAIGGSPAQNLPQTGNQPWAVQSFAKIAKYPSGKTLDKDLFASGVINSGTDFEIHKEVDGGLSGLDFSYEDNTDVYTKNDKLKHLGEKMLAFLLDQST